MARRARFTGGGVSAMLCREGKEGGKHTSEHVFALPV